MPCAEGAEGDSLKTEEKTKLSRVEHDRRTNPTTIVLMSTDPPVHQLGMVSNRVERMPTID